MKTTIIGSIRLGLVGALVAGDLDFASTGSISGIALMASGSKTFYVVGTQDSYATVEGIVARKDIKTVADLKGKKIAVTFASSTHVLVDDTAFSLFKQYGLGPGPDVLVVRKEFAEKYPNTTRAFLEAYFESVQLLKDQPEECAQVLTELTQLSLEEQIKVLKDITWYGLEEQQQLMVKPGSFVEGLQRLADFLARHQQIDEAPDVGQWVRTDLLPR
ncbi:MAG: PhnD/SsuA/transferrin family substrate-binding protein [Thermodesulfobacteriota bacterium]|nr:PhnD/SsuA/transferrin family substrate-binding protein [Thermodesulfobacteriota bacterium]